MARVAGTTTINVDGVRLALKGSITCAFGDNERESIVGLDGRHGFKETFVTPFVEVTVTDTPELNVTMLENVVDATVQVDMANGKKGVLKGATQVNQVNISPEEGEVTFRFEGESGSYL